MRTQLRTLALEHVMDISALNMSDEKLEELTLRDVDRALRDGVISAEEAAPIRRALRVSLRATRRIGELCRTAAGEIEAGRRSKKRRETAPCGAASQQPRQV